MDNSFFEVFREASLVKAEIVAKYFLSWAKIMITQAKKQRKNIAYVDLYSGLGGYEDGSKSTPLRVLEKAIANPDMRELLVTIFNDMNLENTQLLQQAINNLPNVDSLKNKPIILNTEVGEDIAHTLKNIKLGPTLFFLDPWGYKGLSLLLIRSLIKSWGCDCIFFFNYNRINMGVNNLTVEPNMISLFGEERLNEIRKKIKSKSPQERELILMEYTSQALKEIDGEYVLPFRFRNDEKNRTSHYLIFVSKHVLGYSIMKEIMGKESSSSDKGVPFFEYPRPTYQQLSFFDDDFEELKKALLDEFAGQIMTRKEVYERHHVGKPYILKNYKDALLELEQEDKITVEPSNSQRKKNTMGERVKITFLRKP